MIKKITTIFSFLTTLMVFGQENKQQDIGVNMAGLIIKNQTTISPAIFYRYSISDYQLRLQLSLDGNLNNKSRNGLTTQASFGTFVIDSALDFEPGKDIKYGLMLGVQKNKKINGTKFSCYFGLDFMYVLKDFSEKGSGFITQEQQGFKQTTFVELENKSEIKLYGAGLPIGVTYNFGKQFYTSLEAKFILAYQTYSSRNLNKFTINSNDQEFITISDGSTKNQGFDFGIKPLTGLCVGMYF